MPRAETSMETSYQRWMSCSWGLQPPLCSSKPAHLHCASAGSSSNRFVAECWWKWELISKATVSMIPSLVPLYLIIFTQLGCRIGSSIRMRSNQDNKVWKFNMRKYFSSLESIRNGVKQWCMQRNRNTIRGCRRPSAWNCMCKTQSYFSQISLSDPTSFSENCSCKMSPKEPRLQ